MKTDNLLIIAAAVSGVFIVYKMTRAKVPTSTSGTASSLNNGGNVGTTEITNTALPGGSGWGWKYYSDGTSIGPDGKYYSGGTLTYDPVGTMGAFR